MTNLPYLNRVTNFMLRLFFFLLTFNKKFEDKVTIYQFISQILKKKIYARKISVTTEEFLGFGSMKQIIRNYIVWII